MSSEQADGDLIDALAKLLVGLLGLPVLLLWIWMSNRKGNQMRVRVSIFLIWVSLWSAFGVMSQVEHVQTAFTKIAGSYGVKTIGMAMLLNAVAGVGLIIGWKYFKSENNYETIKKGLF